MQNRGSSNARDLSVVSLDSSGSGDQLYEIKLTDFFANPEISTLQVSSEVSIYLDFVRPHPAATPALVVTIMERDFDHCVRLISSIPMVPVL